MAELGALTAMAVRLYRRFVPAVHGNAEDEIRTVLTGNTAVAIAEAAICESAVLGGDASLQKSWDEQIDQNGSNIFNKSLSSITTSGAREAVASAVGLSLAGKRATTFLTGQNIGSTQDLLFSAAGRHLPLVIHLSNNAMAGHGSTKGSGHEGFHLSCDTGVFTLFAKNAQEAVDFSFIARRVAETTLVPGLVVMDSDETACSVQDVSILNPTQLKQFIGPADALIPVPTEAQKLLFGDTRFTVPRWHDVDRPVVAGAVFDAQSYQMGATGKTQYFENILTDTLDKAFDDFERLTGRQYQSVISHNIDGAQSVFVVEGAAIETAITLADSTSNIGVIGLTCLRPFPEEQLRTLLKGKSNIFVLERQLPPPGSVTPLVREISHCLPQQSSRIYSVRYGIGGAALRLVDLSLLTTSAGDGLATELHLGVDFNTKEIHPKRQVLHDQLMRAYPAISTTGLLSKEEQYDISAEGTVSVAVLRSQDTGHDSITRDIADILYRINHGTVRSRPWLSGSTWSEQGADTVIYSDSEVIDPGDSAALDVVCLSVDERGKASPIDIEILQRLRKGGAVVVPALSENRLAEIFVSKVRKEVSSRSLRVLSAPALTLIDQTCLEETVLGAVMGAIVKSPLIEVKERKVFSLRDDALRSLAPAEREVRIEWFKRGFENIAQIDLGTLPESVEEMPESDESAPATVKQLTARDDQFDSVPRFWDQVGILYRDNETSQLASDPYLASGTIAPLSATFRNFTDQRNLIPVIDMEKCTGCGKCWTSCPDSALAPVAIKPSVLIDHGIRLAGADSLRQIANQLGARIVSQAKKQNLGANAEVVLREEYEWLSEKLDLAPDRKQAVDEGLDLVCEKIGSLPLAVTDVIFQQAEEKTKDSGELLSLVVNPDTCKDCGICQSACEAEAISLVPQDKETVDVARKTFSTWATTPDTASETIAHVSGSADVDNMSAVNLSRHCLMSMAGGDGAEPGSGEKIAMRMALATTEYHQQPVMAQFVTDIAELTTELIGETREELAFNLKDDDLDLLGRTVEGIKEPLVELSNLVKNIETSVEANPVDTARLSRLIEVANRLNDLQWKLTSGRQGLGRSRFGLAIAPGTITKWAAAFPYNSFQAPVTLDFSGQTPQMAAGLLEGHLRDTCDTIALVRKARLEIDNPPGLEFALAELDQLKWQDLTDDERQICPPMLIVGNDEILGGEGLAQVLWALGSDLPIKIISFAELDYGIAQSFGPELDQPKDPNSHTGLQALAGRSAYVAQTSIAYPDHFHKSMTDAISYSGPAFLRIHCPSPGRHGFNSSLSIDQALLAVKSQAFPLFSYNPDLPGVHGSRLDISANDLANNDVVNNDVDAPDDTVVTLAHWAVNEKRFGAYFSPVTEEEVVDFAEYINLDERGRKGKTAVVSVISGEEEKRLMVDDKLVRAAENANDTWQVLQELAGTVTPFTSDVEERVRLEVQSEHDAEIAAVREEYEKQLREQGDSVRSDIAGNIRSQLVRLVNSAPSQTE